MLIRRLIDSYLRRGRPALTVQTKADEAKGVEHLAGFNKLVRGSHGLFVANENDTYIGRALIAYGEFCELEWRLLKRYCRPGEVVVEVGANMGGHTVSIAKAVGAQGRVVAIEPQPVVFQALCANLALNCLLNVDALNCGCAESSCVLSIPAIDYSKAGNFGGIELREPGANRPVAVRCEPLDAILHGCVRVDLIKIDVEGMEKEVLVGAVKVIERFRPALYVENDRPQKSTALIEQVHALGYRAWWHTPALYNPGNYYNNAHNLYPGICSFNMLCLPASGISPLDGLQEAVAGDPHPLAGAT